MRAGQKTRRPAEPSGVGAEEGDPGWVCVGVITKPKGVRGAVRIATFTARPDDIAAYGPVRDRPGGGRAFSLELRETRKDGVVATIAGVTDRDAAEALRETRLYVPRTALPETAEDEYYHADLIGLRVELIDGTAFGTVRAVHNYGAGDILEVAPADGATEMLPFTRAVVPVVDIAGGRVVVAPSEVETERDERE